MQVIPKRGNEVLVMSPAAPPRMQRPDWSLRDYAVVEKMYKVGKYRALHILILTRSAGTPYCTPFYEPLLCAPSVPLPPTAYTFHLIQTAPWFPFSCYSLLPQ